MEKKRSAEASKDEKGPSIWKGGKWTLIGNYLRASLGVGIYIHTKCNAQPEHWSRCKGWKRTAFRQRSGNVCSRTQSQPSPSSCSFHNLPSFQLPCRAQWRWPCGYGPSPRPVHNWTRVPSQMGIHMRWTDPEQQLQRTRQREPRLQLMRQRHFPLSWQKTCEPLNGPNKRKGAKR